MPRQIGAPENLVAPTDDHDIGSPVVAELYGACP
jgi:hypothetical protein